MHNFRQLVAAGLIILATAGGAHASVVESVSWAANGEGNRSYSLSSGGFTTTVMRLNDAGRLDSFNFYILDDIEAAPGTGTIDIELWQGTRGFSGSAELEAFSISEADVYNSPTVTSALGFTFFEVTLDLAGFDVRVEAGDEYSLVMNVDGTGTYRMIGTGRTNGTEFGPNPGFAPYVNRFFSTIEGGGSGSVAFSNSFAAFVDTDPDGGLIEPAPVPLPAGLPLLLAGLGGLAMLRRRRG